ncbi:MAG: hypothetical protein PHT87_00560 [Bacteroidales bacterium]|jgi:hypothetical protein|nr:hypothetical protein [Bacteroidales bacterium]MDD2617277.1 hypothetical protein [Bacteroidales bacterium]MDD4640571.1 hypothetical protein [Bacteroidales bacterium]
MFLFSLYALSVESKSEKKLIKRTSSLFFSSEEKAAKAAQEYKHYYACMFDPTTNAEELYCIIVEGRKLDSMYKDVLSTKVYSPEGQLLDSCELADGELFNGRKKESLFHQPGDIVETPCGEELCLGIVLGQPPVFNENQSLYGLSSSDDSYTLIKYPSMEVDYAYAPLVFKPRYMIDDAIKQQLMAAWKKRNLQAL